ncbi:MAG: peptide/nickel transport system ATP-binding protein [Solirubrobacteraceae bacterium]
MMGPTPASAAVDVDPVLDVRDLAVEFGSGGATVRAVRGVSFQLVRGQRLGLVGESGSGKSLTALATMNLIRSPGRVSGGSVLLNGRDVLAMPAQELASVRLAQIAMIYQDPLSSLNPVQPVGRQIVEALRLHTKLTRKEAHERAVELLDSVGVPRPALRFGSYPHEFSGGMRQRVMIAMAISVEPAVLIADEPTTALDVTTQARIIDLLHRLVEERDMAVLLITHDLGLAATFCSDIAVMYAGRIVDRAPARSFYRHPLHPYSEGLLGSVPSLSTDPGLPLPAIPGQPPLAGRVPAGCPFNTRCSYVLDVCREVAPVAYAAPDGAVAECHRADERLRGRIVGGGLR